MVFNSSFVISEIWQISQPKKKEKKENLVEFSTRKNQIIFFPKFSHFYGLNFFKYPQKMSKITG